MSDESEVLEPEVAAETEAASKIPSIEDRTPMPPVLSRFMFVDIAALRAQQLRRGALPRITLTVPGGEFDNAVDEAEFDDPGEPLTREPKASGSGEVVERRSLEARTGSDASP